MVRLARTVLHSSLAYSSRLKRACFVDAEARKPDMVASACSHCGAYGRLAMTYKAEHAGQWHAVCLNPQCPWRKAERKARAWYPVQELPTPDRVAAIEAVRTADEVAKAVHKIARANEAKHAKTLKALKAKAN
ncbi:hypothetical protein FA95DRAFT_1612693, partial [Auriscalpium vulgare]